VIPDWLREKLANPPAAGAGIHAWLFSVARQLHAHMPVEAVGACLEAATVNAARRVTAREIRDAVNNSLAVAWERGGEYKGAVKFTKPSSRLQAGEDREEARWPVADYCGAADGGAGGGAGGGVYFTIYGNAPRFSGTDATADD